MQAKALAEPSIALLQWHTHCSSGAAAPAGTDLGSEHQSAGILQ